MKPFLTVTLVAFTAAVAGTPGGGSSPSGGDDSKLEGWFALGAAAAVAGILIWDIISDSAREEASSDSGAREVVPTGIEWASLRPAPGEDTVIGISVFPGNDGWNLAHYFQQLLLPLEDRGYLFPGGPMNLGATTPERQAAMARDFFECDRFVAATDSSLALLDGEGARTWVFPMAGWDSAGTRSAALDLMSVVSGN